MVYLGADHGGFKIKEELKRWIVDELDQGIVDVGAFALDPEDDYPDFAFLVASKLHPEDGDRGILFCRSGGGMVIASNKVKGIRAVEVFDAKSARHAREHNDANVISLSADWTDIEQIKEAVSIFLSTEFTREERHERRINKISEFEEKFAG